MTTTFETRDRFERDVAELLAQQIRSDEAVGARLWSSMSNIEWHHVDDSTISYSFRSAGDLIARIVGKGCYLDWYMSGPVGLVDPEIATALATRGWHPEPMGS